MLAQIVRRCRVIFTTSYIYKPALLFSIQMLVCEQIKLNLQKSIEIGNEKPIFQLKTMSYN